MSKIVQPIDLYPEDEEPGKVDKPLKKDGTPRKPRPDRRDVSDVQLSLIQKQMIVDLWNQNKEKPPSLDELTLAVWGLKDNGEPYDTREIQGRRIRQYLASKEVKAPVSSEPAPQFVSALTEDDRKYIKEHCKRLGIVTIAKHLFNDDTLTSKNKECRLVGDYISTLPPEITGADVDRELALGKYRPPRSLAKLVLRVNKYTQLGIDEDKLNSRHKKELWKLGEYLQKYRFVKRINAYELLEDMELFESSMIRNTFDKSDLTEDEIDQYIMYSEEVVTSNQLSQNIEYWQAKLQKSGDTDSKILTNVVDILGDLRTALASSNKTQRDLLKDLNGKRSDRVERKKEESNSMLKLVNLWKEEETRIQMIHMAEADKQEIGEEIDKIATQGDFLSLILGIQKEEILNATII